MISSYRTIKRQQLLTYHALLHDDFKALGARQFDKIGSYNITTFRDSYVFSFLRNVQLEVDFNHRWDLLRSAIGQGLVSDCPMYTWNPWNKVFLPNPESVNDFIMVDDERINFIRCKDGRFINELSLMIVLCQLYCISGINWLDNMSIFTSVDIDVLQKSFNGYNDIYLRTFLYSMFYLSKKLGYVSNGTQVKFNIELDTNAADPKMGVAIYYPRIEKMSVSRANYFTNLCLVTCFNDEECAKYPYVFNKRVVEDYYFDEFEDAELHICEEKCICEHSIQCLPESKKNELSTRELVCDSDPIPVCQVSDLERFEEECVLKKEVLQEDGSMHTPRVKLGSIMNDVVHKDDYNDSYAIKQWLELVHDGTKKNLSSFLFFLHEYKDLIRLNPAAKIIFIGCGTANWYQTIPKLLYDRQIVYIDNDINDRFMRNYPNVCCIRRYVDSVEPLFDGNIVVMDMARASNDADLLKLMIDISHVSLCFMYKLRSSWFGSGSVYGKDIFIPPFSYFGSSESRVYGSRHDSKDIECTITLKNRLSRLTKIRRMFGKCHDCLIFNKILSYYIKLPSDWFRYTLRECDANVLGLKVLNSCTHDRLKMNVYLDGCRSCIYDAYTECGETNMTWIAPIKYGAEYLNPRKKRGKGYDPMVRIMVPFVSNL